MTVNNPTTIDTILSADGVNACINILTALPGLVINWVIWTSVGMWILFAAVHSLTVWANSQTGVVRQIANRVNQLFWLIDVAFNLLTGSIWFLELPKSPWWIETFSDRLRRHYRHEARGWRKNLAALFRIPINEVDKDHI
jgi:hypothetical protein